MFLHGFCFVTCFFVFLHDFLVVYMIVWLFLKKKICVSYEPRSKFVTYLQVVGYLVGPLSFYRILNIWGAKMRHSAQKCFCMQQFRQARFFEVMHAYVLRFLKHLNSSLLTFAQSPISVSKPAQVWHAGFDV